MSNTVKITKEEFDKKVRRALTEAFADQAEGDDEDPEYESAAAYGAGVEETPKPFEDRAEATAAAKRSYKELQEQLSGDDAAAYTSGVEGGVRSGTGEQKDPDELVAEAAELSPGPLVDSDDDESDEVYATGVEGSRSHQKALEQKAEERKAELIADALRDVLEEMGEEGAHD